MNHLRSRSFAAGLAGLGLLLVGCTAADSGSGAATTDAAGEAITAAVAPPALLSAGKLKVCASNAGNAPNFYTDDSGEYIGTEVDLANALAEQLGLAIEFTRSEFAALIPTLQSKQCDVILSSLYIKPEREEVVDFVPYLMSATSVAVAEANPAGITGFDDSLCGKKALVSVGSTAETLIGTRSEECEAAGLEPIQLVNNNSAAVALQQLVAGQVDAVVDTAASNGFYEAQDTGIKVVGDEVSPIKIGAAVVKGNSDLQEAIAQAFSELAASGRYDEILAEWGQTSLAVTFD